MHELVALADTQIVKGGERLSKGKLALVQHRAQRLFIMISGFRSVRDMTVIYLVQKSPKSRRFPRLYQVARHSATVSKRERKLGGTRPRGIEF